MLCSPSYRFGNKRHILVTLLLFLCCILILPHLFEGCEDDLITNLPGMPPDVPENLMQYSGYLQGLGPVRLHYWFVQSESSDPDVPFVLWLNGGPGCSSLAGLLEEHGPFTVNEDASTLSMRYHRWTKVAHMLYLESPAGTGFSYGTDGKYTANDTSVRDNNYAALKNFFLKFPQFVENDFYIMGQSYGGIYAPKLAARVVDDPHINFKGLAVGNGYLDAWMDLNSLVYFVHHHGILDDRLWDNLTSECCRVKSHGHCDIVASCSASRVDPVVNLVWRDNYNTYNLNQPCEKSRIPTPSDDNLPSYIREMNYNSYPCMNNSLVIYYLNDRRVQHALHVPSNLKQYGINEWRMCRGVVEYQHGELADMSVKEDLAKVLREGYKVLAYYGEADMACNFLGSKWLIDDLNQTRPTDSYNKWHYKDKHGLTQVAGTVFNYINMTFVTVKGAGHMVPVDKPALAMKLLQYLVNNTQLD